MKYLVNIESIDYARQRNLESKFQVVYLKNEKDGFETWVVVNEKETAQKIEQAIKTLEELF